jgi:hypothetical protein
MGRVFWGPRRVHLRLLFFEKRVFLWLLGDPYDCPDSSPRASAVVSARNPQRLKLADGISFPPGCCAVLLGHASAPAGVAPEALQERGRSYKVFPQRFFSFARC